MTNNDANFVINTPASANVFSLAERVASFNVPVLICGETGTGKECVAKYIHQNAFNEDQHPYIGVNCAAIPEAMLESTLFGYEKGAFTGAINSVAGKFEMANGGTLLLDEIGDMPLLLQAKLLRVLQEHEVERLGSNKRIKLNFRLIACTNKNLQEEVAAGRFREDLYYRLSVVPINIPPLRERREDIMPLAWSFITKYSRAIRANLTLSEAAKTALLNYLWPGNVRELENVIQRGMIMSTSEVITTQNLGFDEMEFARQRANSMLIEHPAVDCDAEATLLRTGKRAQHLHIADLMKKYQGNKSQIAASLGITTRALRYRLAAMRESGIDTDVYF